jgi:hypothetical protein
LDLVARPSMPSRCRRGVLPPPITGIS